MVAPAVGNLSIDSLNDNATYEAYSSYNYTAASKCVLNSQGTGRECYWSEINQSSLTKTLSVSGPAVG